MKHLIYSLTILCLLTTSALRAGKPDDKSKSKAVTALLDYYANERSFNGVVLVSLHGKIIAHKAYGYRNFEKGIKHDLESRFEVGSLTKAFTAEVILMLARSGKIGLQDKIGSHIPGYPNGDKITIEHLLTHTSGIYNYTEDSTWNVTPNKTYTEEQILAFFRDKPLEFEPGSKFEYSNSNYMLLGSIISRVCGRPYADVARDSILVPAGMGSSGFNIQSLSDKYRSQGYFILLEDKHEAAPRTELSDVQADGALYSTASDLFRWHQALQFNKLLDTAWQNKAYRPKLKRYGYGWFADTFCNRKLQAHSGRIVGFLSYIMQYPEEDACIIILSNIDQMDIGPNKMAISISECLFKPGFKQPEGRKVVKLKPAQLALVTGDYEVEDVILHIVKEGDALFLNLEGQSPVKLHALSDRKFFARGVSLEIEFIADAGGAFNSLKVSQDGHSAEAKRK